MDSQRAHHTITSDGVILGATVHGQGPPLVLLHGIENDGDLCWQEVLPHLTERFTCHLLDNRGRGLSGDHPDLSIPRMAQDVVEYVASLGQPVGLVGESFGGNLALIAAARSNAVDAVVSFEPTIISLVGEQEQAVMGQAIAGMAELAEEDDGPKVDDAAMLGELSVPVLVVMGADTRPFLADSARFVVEHAPRANLHEIPGAGHAAALTHPEALAEAITEFFLIARRSGEERLTSMWN